MLISALIIVSILAGSVASVVGFGIGSLVTPVLSLSVGTKLAVAMVSIPHLFGTALRFWMLRGHINRKILLGFGLMSALGGLAGAFLYSFSTTANLTFVFGIILTFSGFMGTSGLSERMRFSGIWAWIAGGTSGLLGGMVGNQGGIRSAALLGFQMTKETFVATATAIGLIVDAFRMPVYFWNEWNGIFQNGNLVLLSTLGVMVGTVLGAKLLKRLPERLFKRIVSLVILILGVFMIYRGMSV